MATVEQLHRTTCRVFNYDEELGVIARCTCTPRQWRIRKERTRDDDTCAGTWRIERWTDDGMYELFLRSSRFADALALVMAMIEVRRTYGTVVPINRWRSNRR